MGARRSPRPGIPHKPEQPLPELECPKETTRHISAHLASGVVMVLGADGGVAFPEGPVAVAVTA